MNLYNYIIYKWTYIKNRKTDRNRKKNWWLSKQKGVGKSRDKLDIWDLQIQTTICKIDKQQGPSI